MKGKPITKMNLIDIVKNAMYVWESPTDEFYEHLLTVWRDNYFNPDWDISTL